METTRGWEDLPADLLERVSNLLLSKSYVRARAVCSSWRAGIPAKPCPPFSQPWLLLPGKEKDSSTFLSVADDNRTFQDPLPLLRGKWDGIVGSHGEWLAVVDRRFNATLLNPLTDEKIRLPPVTTLPGVEAVYAEDRSVSNFLLYQPQHGHPIECSPRNFRDCLIEKIVFAPHPKPHDFVAVVVCHALGQAAAYAKAGDEEWKPLNDPGAQGNHILFNDMMHHDGKFYGLATNAMVQTFDLSGNSPEMTVFSPGWPSADGWDKRLVLSSGSLHQVWRTKFSVDYIKLDDDDIGDGNVRSKFSTREIVVLRYDPERRRCWRRVQELQGQCVLIGSNQSISLQPWDMPGLPGLKCNSIYFIDGETFKFVTDDITRDDAIMRRQIREVRVFDVENESFELCYAPDPRLVWSHPTWFAPSIKPQ